MSTPQIQYSGPAISPEVPWETRRHLQIIYQKLANHTQAFALQQKQIGALKPGSTTTIEGGGGGSTPATPTGISVNNQTGQTSYSLQSGDNGALIIFSDASAIAVELTLQTPPFGCFIANQGALGVGTVTLTPLSGTISYAGNPGAASMPLLPTYAAMIAFDGTNWWAWTVPIVPLTFNAVAHEWINSYNATTGVFMASQPAFSDISGVATTVQIGTGTPSSGEYVDGGTGAWTALPSSGPSVISINAQTASYAALVGDLGKIIQMNSASATTVTLPVTFATGFWLWVKNVGAGTCTASATSGNIDGHASIAIVQAQAYQFYWDGSLWRQLSQSLSV